MIRAVIFDLDGTLHRSPQYETAFQQIHLDIIAQQLRVSPAEAAGRIDALKRELLSLTRAVEALGISRHEFYAELARRMPIDEVIEPRPGLRDIMGQLRRRGLRLGVLTNAGRPLAERVLGALGLAPHLFDAVLTSTEVAPKPTSHPYAAMLNALQLRGREAVYVGDRIETELAPARMAGLWTLLVSESDVESPQVNWLLRDVSELPTLLDTLNRSAPVVWITGIPSSGKSTLATALPARLRAAGTPVEIIETDAVRSRLFPTPTYSEEERAATYGAAFLLAEQLTRHGIWVILSATGNQRRLRQQARLRFPRYVEVYARCSLATAMARDTHGYYRQAQAGGIRDLPGYHHPYEEDGEADVELDTERVSVVEAVEAIWQRLQREATGWAHEGSASVVRPREVSE